MNTKQFRSDYETALAIMEFRRRLRRERITERVLVIGIAVTFLALSVLIGWVR